MKKHGNGRNEDGKITRILIDSWCHQCKMKHQKIVVCDHFWDEEKTTKCNGRYCNNCCKRHYGEEISNLENLENWTCFRCSDKCVCAACRRVRNGEVVPNTTQTNTGISLIQKGKRKRNKSKSVEELDEESVDLSNEEEEEFYPSKFEKNLRSRKNNHKESNIPNNVTVTNNNNAKKPIPFEKKIAIPRTATPKTSPRESPTKKIKSGLKAKINIPEEDLDKANTSNSMFEILLHVTSLESSSSSESTMITPKNNNPLPPIIGNPNYSSNTINLPKIQQPPPNDLKKEQLQKFLKYDSITSNPLHPSSLQTVVHLRQEISQLTNELKNMKQDFGKLQRMFEEYVQTHEGSHESSPINFGDSNPAPYFNQHLLGLHLGSSMINMQNNQRVIEEKRN